MTRKEKKAIYMKKFRQRNVEHLKKYMKSYNETYYKDNAEQIKVRARKRNEENPEYMRRYNKIHSKARYLKNVERHLWKAMIRRCYCTGAINYKNYGGRGITVCRRWLESFEAFKEDIGLRPTPQHSIDRIDNDGNYEPGNVRWATSKEQQNNRRNNKR